MRYLDRMDQYYQQNGAIHDYLGVTIDWSNDSRVRFTMYNLRDYKEWVGNINIIYLARLKTKLHDY